MLPLCRRSRSSLILLLALLAVPFAGCDSAEPDAPNIAGTWSGIANLGGPGFTSSMDLDQNGRSISGIAELPNRRDVVIEGEINASERFVWDAQIGCETWSGSLAIDEAAEEMTGSINLDGESCAPATSASGTLRLSR